MEIVTIMVPETLCELVNGVSDAELERALAAAEKPPEITAVAFRGLGLAFAIGKEAGVSSKTVTAAFLRLVERAVAETHRH
jgi:hypothetical protein